MHPYRTFKSVSWRKKVAVVAVVAIGLSGAGMAAAQWLLNSGTGYVTTGVNAWQVTIAAPTGGPLLAGSGTESVIVTFKNISSTTQTLSDITTTSAYMSSDSNGYGGTGVSNGSGGVYDVLSSAYVDTCLASLFAVPVNGAGWTLTNGTGPTSWAGTGSANVPAGQTELATIPVTLSASAPITCEGLEPQLFVQA